MSLAKGCALFLLVYILSGCYDKFYGPVIHNSTEQNVIVELSMDDGYVVSTVLNPDGKIWQRERNAKITSLTINAGTLAARVFTPQELSRLTLVANDTQILIWKIEGNDVKAELISKW